MGRLIDADKLGIGKANREVFTVPEYADGWNSAVELIENAPTVDAVEVVRCKDCKHTDNDVYKNPQYQEWCCRVGYWVDNDWYCADGERRSDE